MAIYNYCEQGDFGAGGGARLRNSLTCLAQKMQECNAICDNIAFFTVSKDTSGEPVEGPG